MPSKRGLEHGEKPAEDEGAILWRAAQRVSRGFDLLVDLQVYSFLGSVASIVWALLHGTERHGTWRPLIIATIVAAIVTSLMTIVVRLRQPAVLRAERTWALQRAYGMVGHLEAIGLAARDVAELTMVVTLLEPQASHDVTDLTTALTTIAPGGTVSRKGKTVEIRSGSMATTKLASWNRAVVGTLVPMLKPSGIASIALTGARGFLETNE